MSHCASHIWNLETHNSRLDKEAILEVLAQEGNDEFFHGCQLALDPMVTFGLKQIPEKKDEDGPGLAWDGFIAIIERLRNRTLTGNAARDAVDALIAQSTQKDWNGWYRRILIKDLRCGTSDKTINKVVGKTYAQYAIPIFGCQLAHDSANHEAKVCGKKFIEVKLDGVRVITVVYPDGRVDQFSRNGKELVNFPHVKEQFKFIAKLGCFSEPIVFDGEIMSGSFQDLMKQIHRKSSATANDAVLNVFDYMTLAEFEAGGSTASQRHRSAGLENWADFYGSYCPNVTVVAQELVDLDTDAGQTRYKEINAMAIAGGYEGIMLKDVDAPYECKRSHAWLKLKPFIEVSLEITEIEEGTGRNAGRLGAFVCSGMDDEKLITVNVGSGFTDNMRECFWEAQEDLIGKIAEVRADAITQNQDGTYSLRFPRFLRFRGFEAGEKL